MHRAFLLKEKLWQKENYSPTINFKQLYLVAYIRLAIKK